MYKAEIVADSVNKFGRRAITVAVKYPRFILAEVNTHRMFSRNTSSSRAIPIVKMIEQVLTNPVMPVYWGKNKPGMQAAEELTGWRLWGAKKTWLMASKTSCLYAWIFNQIGLHKQIGNRVMEPWLWSETLITSTEWDNFFALRNHPAAQPEIKRLAEIIGDAIDASVPTFLYDGEWHLPYILESEREIFSTLNLIELSTARCARLSYCTHGTDNINHLKDFQLHDDLVGSEPKHASPSEHQLSPANSDDFYFNVRSWKSYRYFLEHDDLDSI